MVTDAPSFHLIQQVQGNLPLIGTGTGADDGIPQSQVSKPFLVERANPK